MNYQPVIPTTSSSRMTEEEADISGSLDFTSRETYLAWVSSWRGMLNENIQEIRQWKAVRRDKEELIQLRQNANTERQALRVVCCNLMALRMASKRKAAQQWQSQRTRLPENA